MTLGLCAHTVPLFLITDRAYGDDTILHVVQQVGQALPPGSFAVQLRDKRTTPTLRPFALRLKDLTQSLQIPLVVNGHVRLALELEADGVHLGGETPCLHTVRKQMSSPCWISMAAHSDAAILYAIAQGADAALVSPLFATPGKGVPRGLSALSTAKRLARGRLALYALGGVGAAEAPACRRAGADGVAVIRALLDASDPVALARSLALVVDRKRYVSEL